MNKPAYWPPLSGTVDVKMVGERAARMDTAVPKGQAEGVKSAQRVLTILELLTNREEPLSFGTIATTLDYPRSSLHGLLRTLTERGWVELDPNTRRYRLGIRTWEAGNTYMRAVTLADRARPFMRWVCDHVDETIQLAILDGRYNIYIAKVEGKQRLVLDSEVGRRLEAHATALGKLLLASLPTEELDRRFAGVQLEKFASQTIDNYAELKRALATIRERGLALDDEEYTPGVHCVAVPVRDHTGQVIAAMSVAFTSARFAEERRQQALGWLREATDGLSTALGYHVGDKAPAKE
jgi:DNA-binding IclR family transcriptional regulator